MSKSKTYKLILTSKGLNTRKGTILIRRAYEKEKIKYHMTDYGTSHELKQLLASIGFSKIEEKQNYKWVVYVVTKSD